MVFDADVISLVLYCVQQLGVVLGVGAETIMLIAYLVSLRDGVVDPKEAQFSRAVLRVLAVGVILMILSGVGVVFFHVFRGEEAILLQPAFLFKWLLIMAVTVFGLSMSREYAHPLWQGVIGGTWYALFLVHILAPVTTWVELFELYAFWLTGSVLVWYGLIFALKGNVMSLPKPVAVKTAVRTPPAPARIIEPVTIQKVEPKPVIATPPLPVPVIKKEAAPLPLPVPAKHGIIGTMVLTQARALPALPIPPIPQKPIPLNTLVPKAPIPQKPHESAPVPKEARVDLPAILVMPRTPEDLSVDHRGQVIELKPA